MTIRLLESGTARSTEVATTLRALESYVATGVVYSDNFNRADSLPWSSGYGGIGLGTEWEEDAWRITGNRAERMPDGGAQPDYCTFLHDIGSPDHWAEFKVYRAPGGYGVLNARRPVDNGQTGYLAYWHDGSARWVIGKVVSGSYNDVTLGPSTPTPTAGMLMRLEVEGTAIRLYVDNVLVMSTTDSSVTTGNYTGMNANSNPSSSMTFDDFRCGPLPYTPP